MLAGATCGGGHFVCSSCPGYSKTCDSGFAFNQLDVKTWTNAALGQQVLQVVV